jgi:HD-GYP domain-containing protein (c-di-GMP phosphodiesterase class II)
MHTRMAEIFGRLSLAFDVANDAPFGRAVRSVVLATELGAFAGADDEQLRDTYWLSVFANLGCTGFAYEEGQLGAGDDRSVRNAMAMFSIDDARASIVGVVRRIAPEAPLGRRVRAIAGLFTDRTLMDRFQRAMCDSSIRLAEIVGAGPRILSALGELCERWDGRGVPSRLEGEALALPIRLHQIARVVEIAHDRHGRAGAAALIRRRAGGQFDPRLSKILLENQTALFEAIEDPGIFDRFLDLEPKPETSVDECGMDDIARALAIFTDLKCPIFFSHSTGVAALAVRAASHLDLGTEDTRALRWAALLHDIGRTSVPNGVWMRPGPLDWGQRERVRLHAYYTERILSPVAALGPATDIAVAAHERIDGSGYHQHRAGRSLTTAARLLAAADMAFAMSEERPHRPAHDQAAITSALVADARAGRLDATAVDAVLASLGVEARTEAPDLRGLSERELEVSRLLVRGKTNREIGDVLGISVRTVHNHVAHIFDKLGVHSRSGAAIWLMEHDFVR